MSKAARERSARERLAEERRRQQARQKQVRLLTAVLGAVVVVAVAVVVIVVAMNSSKDDKKVTANLYKGATAPVQVAADGTVTMGQPNAKGPTVDLYEDFQCPICKEFEKASGDTIKKLAADGKITVKYHILSFVNPEGSPRAAVAGWCAADSGKFLQFHDVAYQNQPDERKALSVDTLKKFGATAGASGDYDKCVSDQKYKSQVKKNNDDGLSTLQQKFGGKAGTPSMLVNGKPVDQNAMFDPSALQKALGTA
ncbi:DsbA family protein [Actinomadura rupiterrae]|uniref:DsbA family protein n=1 Tax=Actinomadura rupiterrae TaxID=559627 RepID=UPI0020A4C5F2|nr:thioredoxin domain-containing protein [Actinomadura rupiterrae]MCP2338212.1 protein-disulfide isomerase [Actinomadura rupiterrae]